MGLTKRKDGWYVEFRVVDDDKVLSLSPGGTIGRMKRWKTGTTNKTVAKQWEAKLKTDLLMGKISSSYGKVMSFEGVGGTVFEVRRGEESSYISGPRGDTSSAVDSIFRVKGIE